MLGASVLLVFVVVCVGVGAYLLPAGFVEDRRPPELSAESKVCAPGFEIHAEGPSRRMGAEA
jgi:hypothetical protein